MTGHTPPARGAVAAWGLWDWAFSAFNAVATTFVFSTYLSGKAFGNPAHESELLGVFTAVAGVIIAVVAPVAGQRSDASGRRKLWLAINSGAVVACLLGMVFVRNQPGYLWAGLACIAVGTVFFELASVFCNSLLPLISTPGTVGRISAFGWSHGVGGAGTWCSGCRQPKCWCSASRPTPSPGSPPYCPVASTTGSGPSRSS